MKTKPYRSPHALWVSNPLTTTRLESIVSTTYNYIAVMDLEHSRPLVLAHPSFHLMLTSHLLLDSKSLCMSSPLDQLHLLSSADHLRKIGFLRTYDRYTK